MNNIIERLINVLTVIIFIAMTVVVFSQVVLRYGFEMNIHWADEFARSAMIWIAFLGAAIGIKYEEHTRIDFFVKLLPSKGRLVVEILNKIICIAFLGIISYFSIATLGDTMTLKTPSLQIPTGFLHLIIPIAGIIMIAYLILQIIEIIKNINEKGDQLI